MNRTLLYYGPEAFEKIKKGFVIVVGVGGVGSAAAHVLLRSGVSRIRIIDPGKLTTATAALTLLTFCLDLVTLSSLNRNSLAQRQDVGRSKVQVLKGTYALNIHTSHQSRNPIPYITSTSLFHYP